MDFKEIHIIVKATEQWYVDDIANIVILNFIRRKWGYFFLQIFNGKSNNEFVMSYNEKNNSTDNNNDKTFGLVTEEEYVNRHDAKLNLHWSL